MPNLRTITEAISQEPEADRVYAQVRGLHNRGHLRSAGMSAGQHVFGKDEMFVAAILVAAVDAGVEGRSLSHLESEVRNGRRVVHPSAGNYEINLSANLARIEADETWNIECARSRDPESGEVRFAPLWVRVEADGRVSRFSPLYPSPAASPLQTVDGANVQSLLSIPAAELLRPLIKAYGV